MPMETDALSRAIAIGYPCLSGGERAHQWRVLTLTRDYVQKSLHLDRRAAELAAQQGDDDELLTTKQQANWFGTSEQWLTIGRHKGYGPPFLKIGNMVRYQRGTSREW